MSIAVILVIMSGVLSLAIMAAFAVWTDRG
jgi:hypothetical protein